jgi:hypothetical protein
MLMSTNKRQVYFVVYVDEADGSVVLDNERAEIVFGGDDVWDDETQKWSAVYAGDNIDLFRESHRKLLELVSTTWGGE